MKRYQSSLNIHNGTTSYLPESSATQTSLREVQGAVASGWLPPISYLGRSRALCTLVHTLFYAQAKTGSANLDEVLPNDAVRDRSLAFACRKVKHYANEEHALASQCRYELPVTTDPPSVWRAVLVLQ